MLLAHLRETIRKQDGDERLLRLRPRGGRLPGGPHLTASSAAERRWGKGCVLEQQRCWSAH